MVRGRLEAVVAVWEQQAVARRECVGPGDGGGRVQGRRVPGACPAPPPSLHSGAEADRRREAARVPPRKGAFSHALLQAVSARREARRGGRRGVCSVHGGGGGVARAVLYAGCVRSASRQACQRSRPLPLLHRPAPARDTCAHHRRVRLSRRTTGGPGAGGGGS